MTSRGSPACPRWAMLLFCSGPGLQLYSDQPLSMDCAPHVAWPPDVQADSRECRLWLSHQLSPLFDDFARLLPACYTTRLCKSSSGPHYWRDSQDSLTLLFELFRDVDQSLVL